MTAPAKQRAVVETTPLGAEWRTYVPAWPPVQPPNDSATITALLSERAELIAENHALRAERDHLARMLNPPPR